MIHDGEDKLIAVARHISNTLGRTETMADDILQIFSNFDGRLSREKFSEKQNGSRADEDEDDDSIPAFSNLERTLRSLDRQISRFVASDRPIWSDSAESLAFLEAFDGLLAVLRELDPEIPGDKTFLDQADDLLQQSMFRMEDEFRSLMENQNGGSPPDPIPAALDSDGEESDDEGQIPVGHPVADYDIVIDALPSGTIADLNDIAKRMVVAGFGKACAHTYSISRGDFIEESISRLGVRARTIEEVQGTPWQDLEREIGLWTCAVNVAFRILFPSERRLCDRVFAGLSPIADLSFAEICRGAAAQLLGFADAVAIGSKAPERFFRIVDMYEALCDLIPEIDSVFSDQYGSFLRSDAGNICKRLGAAIRGIFTELENLIRRDPPKSAVPGGGAHKITRYVINFLRAASESRRTLEEVMGEEGSVVSTADHDRQSSSSSLSVQIAWIMELLQGNLEAKSKVYGHQALSYVFLMNNGRYIIEKVKASELGPLLGDDWIRRLTARMRHWNSSYQKSTWNKVIAVLHIDGGGGGSSETAAAAAAAARSLRERFSLFNAYFEEICQTHMEWVIADEQLKTELRTSAVGLVIPAYQKFLGRFRNVHPGPIKYSVEDVKCRINELFLGSRKKL